LRVPLTGCCYQAITLKFPLLLLSCSLGFSPVGSVDCPGLCHHHQTLLSMSECRSHKSDKAFHRHEGKCVSTSDRLAVCSSSIQVRLLCRRIRIQSALRLEGLFHLLQVGRNVLSQSSSAPCSPTFPLSFSQPNLYLILPPLGGAPRVSLGVFCARQSKSVFPRTSSHRCLANSFRLD
jgi:hypothetical protein